MRARLARLREAMREHEIAAYLVPSSDPHQSEYVPEHWARRAWASGFTGSAGDLVVESSGGGLWTDGRYHLQARQQLRGTGIRLFPVGEKDVPAIEEHLATTLPKGAAVGVDPAIIGMRRARRIANALGAAGVALKPIDENLVDTVRGPVPRTASARPRRAPARPLCRRDERVEAPPRPPGDARARGRRPPRHHPRRDRLALQRAGLRRRLQPGGHRVRGGDRRRGGRARRSRQARRRRGGAPRSEPPASSPTPPSAGPSAGSPAARAHGVDRSGGFDESHVRALPRRSEAGVRTVAHPPHEGAQERRGARRGPGRPPARRGWPWCASSTGSSARSRMGGITEMGAADRLERIPVARASTSRG